MLVDAESMKTAAVSLFHAAGASRKAADAVATHLVDASLRGLHSHGVLRIPQYLDEAENHAFDPAATPKIAERRGAFVRVDGRRAFGQVGGEFAAKTAVETASRLGCALVSIGRLGHTGRVGAYAERIAQAGKLGLVFASATGLAGRWVAPHGASDGRLFTAPIAYAFRTETALVSADFATSATAEGVVRSLLYRGMPAPPWMLRDSDGEPTTDPAVLYGSPPGTIQLLGGEGSGHKGMALSLMVETVATIVGGFEYDDAASPHNTLAVMAIETDAGFTARASRYTEFVSSAHARDPNRPIMLPGTPERLALERARGVEIDPISWESLGAWADRFDVILPQPLA